MPTLLLILFLLHVLLLMLAIPLLHLPINSLILSKKHPFLHPDLQQQRQRQQAEQVLLNYDNIQTIPLPQNILSRNTRIHQEQQEQQQQQQPRPTQLPSLRIISGSPALLEPLLNSVSLMTNTRRCSGTLLTSTWVITAAHCGSTAGITTVMIAGANRRKVGVRKVVVHPKWIDSYDVDNGGGVGLGDLALVELEGKIEYGAPWKRGIVGVSVGDIEVGGNWGEQGGGVGRLVGVRDTTENDGVFEDGHVWRMVDLPVVGLDRCRRTYGNEGEVGQTLSKGRKNFICVGYVQGGFDSFTADSGGGCFVKTGEELVLAGIVLGNRGCGKAGKPVILTRIGVYTNWVKTIVGDGLRLIVRQSGSGSDRQAVRVKGCCGSIWWHAIAGLVVVLTFFALTSSAIYFFASRAIRRAKITKRLGVDGGQVGIPGYDPRLLESGSRGDGETDERRGSSRLTRTTAGSLGEDSLLSQDAAGAAALAEAIAKEKMTWKDRLRGLFRRGAAATDSDSEYVSLSELDLERRRKGITDPDDLHFIEDFEGRRDSYVHGATGALVIGSAAAARVSGDGDELAMAGIYGADSWGRRESDQTLLRDYARESRGTHVGDDFGATGSGVSGKEGEPMELARKQEEIDLERAAARLLHVISEGRIKDSTLDDQAVRSSSQRTRSSHREGDTHSSQSRQTRVETGHSSGDNVLNARNVTSPSERTRSFAREGEGDNGRSISRDTGEASFNTARSRLTRSNAEETIPVENGRERLASSQKLDADEERTAGTNVTGTATSRTSTVQRNQRAQSTSGSTGAEVASGQSVLDFEPLKKSGLEMWEFGLHSNKDLRSARQNGNDDRGNGASC